jgi:dicarboxylate transporter 10
MDCKQAAIFLLWQVHQQTQQDVNLSVFRLTMNVIKQDGFLSLSHGLTAAVLRQLTYSTTRFAVYEVFMSVAVTNVSVPVGGWAECSHGG